MPAAFQTFEELGLRFMNRPHASVRREPLGGPAAWRGADLSRSTEWIHDLPAEEVAEVEAALARVERAGIAMADLTREEFPLPRLGETIRVWARELASGRGFVLVRGLPIERWTEQQASLVYWGLGQHLGTPGEQNARRELLGHVRDTGAKAHDPHVRQYQTTDRIDFHVDLSDAVGLLCLRPALRGGASRIVSSATIHDEFLRRRPDLVDTLYDRFWVDRRGEHGPEEFPAVPVPICRHAGGRLSIFYHTEYFRTSQRHPQVPRYTDEQKESLALWDSIASDADLALDMTFEPGDIQLLSNHTILHARDEYEDGAEPAAKRHLLRLWISLHAFDA